MSTIDNGGEYVPDYREPAGWFQSWMSGHSTRWTRHYWHLHLKILSWRRERHSFERPVINLRPSGVQERQKMGHRILFVAVFTNLVVTALTGLSWRFCEGGDETKCTSIGWKGWCYWRGDRISNLFQLIPEEEQYRGKSRCLVELLVCLCSLAPKPKQQQIISGPFLENSFLKIAHLGLTFRLDHERHRQMIYPVVKHVDEGGVVVHGLPHHSLPQPLPIKLHWLTIRTWKQGWKYIKCDKGNRNDNWTRQYQWLEVQYHPWNLVPLEGTVGETWGHAGALLKWAKSNFQGQ